MILKKFIINLLIFLISFLFLQSLIAQEIFYNQEFRVDSLTGYHTYPCISALADSGFIVTWISYGQEDSYNGVYAQRFDKHGNKMGAEFRVNSTPGTSSNFHARPSVAGFMNGNFVVCWYYVAYPNGLREGCEVYAQLFDSDGNKINSEFLVNTYTIGNQSSPKVCCLINNKFVICWMSTDQDGSGEGIYAQLFDSSGEKIGTEFQVNSVTFGDQYYPSINGLSNGGFVVCWMSSGQDASGSKIYAQLFDNNGNKIGTEFQINSNTIYDLLYPYPSVCGLLNGRFAVCWRNDHQDGNYIYPGISGQLYDNNGTRLGTEFNVVSGKNISSNPTISSLTNGGFVICWGGYGIYAQLFDNNGKRVGVEFQVTLYHIGALFGTSANSFSDGGFAVCWVSSNWDELYVKYFLNPLNHQLSSFSLLEPDYDSTIETESVTFKWSAASKMRVNIPWELEYRLYLAEDEQFSTQQVFSPIYDTTYTVEDLIPGKTYFWKVWAWNIEEDRLWSTETYGFYFNHVEYIEVDEENIPSLFELFTNYPNPFNPQTTIRYRLPGDQSVFPVVVQIYDLLGQLVITLKNERQHPGVYNLTWDGRDASGRSLPSGIYFCRLAAGQYSATQKMLLVR